MYGLTECKRVSYLPPELVDAHPDSVGVPIPGCEVEVVDESGRPLQTGRVGELVVRGPTLMSGYWERPEETARALRPGPWPGEKCLWTGDLFYRNRKGLLYFVGRTDDVFKSRGEKCLQPRSSACCFGTRTSSRWPSSRHQTPSSARGPTRFVVMSPGTSSRSAALRRHCAEALEPYKRPHRFHLVERLPRNDRGKVDRAVLATLASRAVESTPSESSPT